MRFRPQYVSLISLAVAATLSAQSARAITIDFEDVIPRLSAGFQTTVTVPDQILLDPNDPNFVQGQPAAPQVSQGFDFRWLEIDSGSPFPPPFDTHGHLSRGGKEEGDAWVWVASNDPTDPLLSTTYLITDDSAFEGLNNTLTISPVGFIPAGIGLSHDPTDDDDDDQTGGGTPPAPATGFSIQSFEVAEIFSSAQSARQMLVEGFLDDGDELVDFTLTVDLDEDFTVDPTVPRTTAFQTVQFGPEWAGLKRVVFDGLGATDASSDYFAVDNIVVNEPVIVDPPPDDPNDPNDPNDPIGVAEPSGLAGFGFGAILLGWIAQRRRARALPRLFV